MKLNKCFLLITVVAIFTCCTSQQRFVQIAQTTAIEHNGLIFNQDNKCYEYVDEACTIAYNMWSVGGQIQYVVTNRTDDILYIDNTSSCLVKNGVSLYAASVTPKEQYVSVFPIAPHSTATIVGPNLDCPLYLDCDLNRTPLPNKPVSITYEQDDTPMTFHSVLCYKLSNSTKLHVVDNAFYISRLTNYRSSDLYETNTEYKKNCVNVEGNTNSTLIRYDLLYFAPSNGFMHKYVLDASTSSKK